MREQIFNLADAVNLNLVGGKAHALGKMIRAGLNVPKGFVLSANAFMSMTQSLQELILSHFDALGADFVAVRSSAINEDGANAAWAGQLDTFLNCNRDNLLQSIEKCWKSAYSARAQSYAEQKSIQSKHVAVVVQAMIQSEVSGVAFSVHPVSNDDKQVVIEAGLGLGEAIVSGEVTPDTYVVDKKSGQLIELHVSQQKKQLIRSAVGGTVWEKVGSQGNSQKLSDNQIAELCKLTTKLEAYFQHPVDVEWAVKENKVYILQSRPITTLAPG